MKCPRSSVVLACLGLFCLPSHSQTAPARMLTESIDETRLVTLPGNVHPLARAQYDRAKVDDPLAVKRVLFVAEPSGRAGSRSPEISWRMFTEEVQ